MCKGSFKGKFLQYLYSMCIFMYLYTFYAFIYCKSVLRAHFERVQLVHQGNKIQVHCD